MAWLSKEEQREVANRLGIDISAMTYQEANGILTKAMAANGISPPSPNKGNRKNPLDQYIGKTVLISPEMAPTQIQRIKYDEEIGDELKVEEQKVYLGILKEQQREKIDGTVVVKGKTGRRTVAQSTLPKINVEITFRPTVDLFPVGRFEGRIGYLWTQVKGVLIKSGYWEEYKTKFKADDISVFYLGGKQMFCSIPLVHEVFKEIERKEKMRRQQDGAV